MAQPSPPAECRLRRVVRALARAPSNCLAQRAAHGDTEKRGGRIRPIVDILLQESLAGPLADAPAKPGSMSSTNAAVATDLVRLRKRTAARYRTIARPHAPAPGSYAAGSRDPWRLVGGRDLEKHALSPIAEMLPKIGPTIEPALLAPDTIILCSSYFWTGPVEPAPHTACGQNCTYPSVDKPRIPERRC